MKRKLGKVSAKIILKRGVACSSWRDIAKIRKTIAPKKLVSAIDILKNPQVNLLDRLYVVLRLASVYGTVPMDIIPTVPSTFFPIINKLIESIEYDLSICRGYLPKEIMNPLDIYYVGIGYGVKIKNKIVKLLKEWENASE